MEFTITKEQIERLIKMAEYGSTNVIKSDLKNWFPKAFKTELIVGKWYKHTSTGNIIYCSKIASDGTLYGYGFMFGQFQVYEDEKSGYCICNSVSTKYLIDASNEVVEEALIKKGGYKKGSKTKCLVSHREVVLTSEPYYSGGGINCKTESLPSGYAVLFMDGEFAEILPEEKTVITKEKALKILAKKTKSITKKHRNQIKTPQKFIIPIELTESFVKPHDRQVTHADFQKWFAEILFKYHPMNNQIF